MLKIIDQFSSNNSGITACQHYSYEWVPISHTKHSLTAVSFIQCAHKYDLTSNQVLLSYLLMCKYLIFVMTFLLGHNIRKIFL